jgi:ribose 1,5-bisphosphokinase
MGPSGAGKDTLIERALALSPFACVARRYVTRKAKSKLDCPLSLEEFSAIRQRGSFLFNWDSHGFSYGIKREDEENTPPGKVLIINGSREYLQKALEIRSCLVPILVEARLEILKERLIKRGRELPEQIEKRLARAEEKLAVPRGICINILDNSGDLKESANKFCQILKNIIDS